MPAVDLTALVAMQTAPAPKAKAKKKTTKKKAAKKATALATVEDIANAQGAMTVEALAAAQDIVPVDTRVAVPKAGGKCTRCDGAGKKAPYKGDCFRCEGDGIEPTKEVAKARWEAGQAKRDKAAARKAKAETPQSDLPVSFDALLALQAADEDETPAPVAEASGTTALKLAIADAVIGLGSPDGLPAEVQAALLKFYMAK